MSGKIMSSSHKREKSISSTIIETKPEEDTDVSRNLKSTDQPAKMSVHSMSSSVNHKNGKSSTERQLEPQEAVDYVNIIIIIVYYIVVIYQLIIVHSYYLLAIYS